MREIRDSYLRYFFLFLIAVPVTCFTDQCQNLVIYIRNTMCKSLNPVCLVNPFYFIVVLRYTNR